MASLINLPGYAVPNALSFQGINQAIDSNRQNALAQEQMGMQRQQLGMQTEKHGLQMAAAKREQEVQEARRVAGTVQGIMALPEQQRMAAWQQTLTQPGFRDLPPEMRDLQRAAPLLLSKAAEYMDPLDRRAKESTIGMQGAHSELYRAQAAEFRRKAGEPGLPGGFKDPKQLSDVEEGIRKEYSAHAKPYFETRDAYSRISQAASNPSPAGDLALIFNFMKMLDPGSVVREGEFATAQNAAGIPERVRNMWNRAISGERLGDDQRKDFVGQANGLYSRAERQYVGTQRQYEDLARRKGIDPRNVILNYDIPKTQDGRLEPPASPRADRQQVMPPRVGGGPGAQGMIPPQAVQFLRGNPSPEIIQQFEAKYGPGSAQQFMGGQ
jgi:hypothetical protein